MHATQIKHKELVEILVVVLRGFAPRIIWKVVMDGILRGGHEHSAPARKIVRKSGGSTQTSARPPPVDLESNCDCSLGRLPGSLLHRPPHPHLLCAFDLRW